MNLLVLVLLVVGGGWWYFHGGRIITDTDVRDFYQLDEAALLSRNPDALCNFLAPDYSSEETAISLEGRQTETSDRAKSCEAYRQLFDSFEQIGAAMGGMVQLDHRYHIDSIAIAADRKSATASTTFKLDVAGSIMNFEGSTVDTLIRRNGKMLLLKRQSKVRVSSG
ncbi:MAG: hypothetical protein FIA97_08990 [Methylococcaceae bacterium]|nr:hypothetical protein [Methylococcaceae bacterium]